MLYKQMQVKEIPVIFRGAVDPAAILTPSDTITIACTNMGASWYYSGWSSSTIHFEDYDYLYVSVDGNFYGKIEKQVVVDGFGTHNYFGAKNGSNPVWDFSEYPFAISQNAGDTFFRMIANNSSSHVYDIWVGDYKKPTRRVFSSELTGNGQIKRFHARFACGENGTLHLSPYVILNGNITVNLCDFAKEGENYISGDNEDFTFECYVPIETHAMLYVEAENTGDYASILDVAIVVQYEDFIEEETIVGYEGINLGRKRR